MTDMKESGLERIQCAILNSVVTRSRGKADIHRLPMDVWLLVFAYGHKYLSLSPLSISSVCQFFRNMALNTPSLWCNVDLDTSPKLIDIFLKRSQEASLSVKVNRLATYEELRTELTDIYSINPLHIRELSCRCQHVPNFGALNNLQSLCIIHYYIEIAFFDVINQLPLLQHLHCPISRFSKEKTPTILPRHGLKTFTTFEIGMRTQLDVASLFDILHTCPDLEQLQARIVRTTGTCSRREIHLPHLRSLGLQTDGSPEIIFQTLRLPSLKELSLISHQSIILFEDIKWGCKPEEIIISGDCDLDGLTSWLRTAGECLTRMTFSNSFNAGRLFDALCGDKKEVLCPSLLELGIGDLWKIRMPGRPSPLEVELLLAVVFSRFHYGLPRLKVKLNGECIDKEPRWTQDMLFWEDE